MEQSVTNTVSEFSKHYNIKSRNLTKETLDLVIEIRITNGSELVKKIMEIEGVSSASLLSHDGEVTF